VTNPARGTPVEGRVDGDEAHNSDEGFARLKLEVKPSVASIYRLEQGQAIRVAHARRVFGVMNVDGKLKPEDELVDE
jgi:hypothetical protein